MKVGKKHARWWIGLYKFGLSSFVWSDGSPLNFVNWDYDEPSDANGGEDCVEMFSSSCNATKLNVFFLIIYTNIQIFYFKIINKSIKRFGSKPFLIIF